MLSRREVAWFVGILYSLQAVGGNPGFYAQLLTKTLKDNYELSTLQVSSFTTLIGVPWMIKPVYGLLSDFVPLFGTRRRHYFTLSAAISGVAFLCLGLTSAPSLFSIQVCMFFANIGVAFADVLCDAVMVEVGNPMGSTDKLQSIQWASNSLAGAVSAFIGGYVAQDISFQYAILAAATIPLVQLLYTHGMLAAEVKVKAADFASTGKALRDAASSRALWAAGGFIFLYGCSPSLGTSLYFYQKDQLHFSDVWIGQLTTLCNLSFLLGTIVYGQLAPRLSYAQQLRLIIASGTCSTLLYLFYMGPITACVVTFIAGITSVGAFLGSLTMAAKACPAHSEGTVFASLMALSNIGTRVGDLLGGYLYENLSADKHTSYFWLVWLSAGFTALMSIFLPFVTNSTQSTRVDSELVPPHLYMTEFGVGDFPDL